MPSASLASLRSAELIVLRATGKAGSPSARLFLLAIRSGRLRRRSLPARKPKHELVSLCDRIHAQQPRLAALGSGQGCADELAEEGVGAVGAALELGVRLG